MKAHPMQLIAQLSEMSGPGSQKAKRELVEEHLSVPEFVKTVEYALDPWKQFYMTTVPGLNDIATKARRSEKEKRSGRRDLFDTSPEKMTWKEQFRTMFDLLDKLSSRQLPPNSSVARTAILVWAEKCGEGTIGVFRRILQKDLRCGMKAASFNKVKPGWVPEFKVQLAQSFNADKLQFPCFVDPKFDGERCLVFVTYDGDEGEVTYWSRNGNQFLNYGCFDREVMALCGAGCHVLDCEVIHIKGFQTGQKVPVNHDPSFDPTGLQLIVFDFLPQTAFEQNEYDPPLEDRYQKLTRMFSTFNGFIVKMVETRIAKSYEEALQIYEYWVNQGLEGIIIKQPDGKYEFKRSDTWMKLKPKKSEDLKIVGMELGDDNKQWAGKCGSLIVERKDPTTGNVVKIGVASGLTHFHHENIKMVGDQILYHQEDGTTVDLKGKLIEVTYDCATEDGSRRFPRIKP